MAGVIEMREFHASEEDSASEGYRAISKISVMALVLGLLSLLAPVFPAFWIFPVLGLLIALVALFRLNRTESNLAGRGLAVTGLLLALLFGSMGLARHYAHRAILNSQAEEFGTRWFGLLLKGSTQQAHQLVMDPKQRLSPRVILSEQYQNDVQLQETLNKFTSEELIQDVLANKDHVTFTLVDNVSHYRDQQTVTISQIYHVTFQKDEATRIVPLELKISCQFDKTSGQTYWTITDYQELDRDDNG